VNFAPDGQSTNPNYESPPLPSFQVKVEAGRVSIFSL
jgi:nitrite reductase/ring-hydroxylating ferredoxin subunit